MGISRCTRIYDATTICCKNIKDKRFSFGYPACPNLEDQEKLFKLLHPERIGLQLTEGFMMEPEAAVTAIVFSHPEARYFNVM